MTLQKRQRPSGQRHSLAAALAWAVLPLATPVQAQSQAPTPIPTQVVPDAGQILQQLQPPVEPPRESLPPTVQAPGPSGLVLPGGAQVVVQTVSFAGHTAISEAALQAALGTVAGSSFDLAGLRGLTDRISDLYRASGFPFARAVLPPQDLQDGVLRIEIIEGRYGLVQAVGKSQDDSQNDSKDEDAALAVRVQPFLKALKPGAVIESGALERTSHLLSDLPGVQSVLVIRPGAQAGTGDLIAQVSGGPRVTGDVGLDNAGSRYTGETRARANLSVNSPFVVGDQINLLALLSDERLWLGSLGYSLPLGTSGLRGQLGYSHTSYELAKEFANLQAHGTAQVASAGLSYPLVRTQKTNLTLGGAYQSKELLDKVASAGIRERKSSTSVPVTLQFDHRDSAGGGGITYGSMVWTPGDLTLDAALTAADANNTRGSFNKLNLDVVRLQALPAGLTLKGRLSLQTASKNLDSSEQMTLGGASSVRAYPMGEASGDEGVLAQLELRYAMGAFAPYVFWDGGSIKTRAKPLADATQNERSLSGAGLGMRYQRDAWSADVALAWRGSGGAPQADTSSDPSPRVWASLAYRF